VVEDQEEVSSFVAKALTTHGYRVIQAAEGNQALTLAERHSGTIDVLLTDVVLPGMNGRELADRFRIGRPDTRSSTPPGIPRTSSPTAAYCMTTYHTYPSLTPPIRSLRRCARP
jgi:CheY-like chemotaxis protein